MSKWPMVPLTEVLQLQRRWIKLQPTETYREIGIRSFGNGIFHKAPIQGSTLGNKRVLRIEPGDLVFNNVFAWEGAVAVAGPEEAGMIGSHRFVTYTLNPAKATAEFLQLFFKTKAGREILLKASPGSAGRNKTLGLDRFITQSVPLPPVAEQRRLVECIDALAAKIKEAERLRAEASRELATVREFSPAKSHDGNRWPLISMEQLVGRANLKNGKSLKVTSLPSDIQCLTLASMRGGVIDTTECKPVPMSLAEAQPFLVRPGDVFVVRGNGSKHLVGRAGYVANVNQLTIYPDLFIKIPIQEETILAKYFVTIWNSQQTRNQIEDSAKTTSGNWKINQGHIASIAIPVPPIADQRVIVDQVEAIEKKCQAVASVQNATGQELDALLPTILDRAFRGEL